MNDEQPDRPHVLIVDDDRRIRDVVSEYLLEEGFSVAAVGDGPAMQEAIGRRSPDIVLLDVRLPGDDGLTLAAQLRQSTTASIIMLSEKSEVVDRVAGLEVGADDYISKPFHLRELLARIRSVLRRASDEAARPVETSAQAGEGGGAGERFFFRDWVLDAGARTLSTDRSQAVELSSGEFDLLLAFVRNPRRVMSRERLLDLTRNRYGGPFDRSVDVQVGRLRRKIEAEPRRPELIKTKRGAGYVFTADVRRQKGTSQHR